MNKLDLYSLKNMVERMGERTKAYLLVELTEGGEVNMSGSGEMAYLHLVESELSDFLRDIRLSNRTNKTSPIPSVEQN